MGWFSDRRALAELRGLRRAAERIADALEQQIQQQAPAGGRSFRGFSRDKHAGVDHSGVSYVDPQQARKVEAAAQELRAFFGRDPTEEELLRVVEERVE